MVPEGNGLLFGFLFVALSGAIMGALIVGTAWVLL
jgi:hypothetical protein